MTLPEGWKHQKVFQVCVSENGVQTGPFGSQLHQKDYVATGTPIITVEHLGENRITRQNLPFVSAHDVQRLKKYTLDEGDIVFSRVGSVDRRALVREDEVGWMFSGRCLRVRSDRSIVDPRFLSFQFGTSSFKNYIKAVAVGATMPSINTSILSDAEVVVPPLPEQIRIADVLASLDDKIELNRRMNETLEEMSRALFRDWFVDFGPTRRQADGATDPAAIMGNAFPPEKAATLAPLFPAEMGENGLPEGWSHGTAADHIDFNPKEPLKKGNVAPYSDMASLPTSGSLIAPPVDRDFKSGMRFRNGDALIARITPCLENGKAGFVDYLTEDAPVGWGSTEFFVLRSKPHVAPQFAYCLVRDPDFRKRAEQSMTGTSGRQRAQIEVLTSHELAVPDESVHSEFWAITAPFFEKIKANGDENQTLAEMRDLLLPKLMSGEIRLKGAEVVV